MKKHAIYYCYDAYCGWCYGFSPVMKKLAAEYADTCHVEVLSGGMITGEYVKPVSALAGIVKEHYPIVEETTGIKFGQDFLWHMLNPDKSDWFPNSLKPAIAMVVFKEIYPERQVEFASDLQYALNFEGRDLDDDEAYRHLLEKYAIEPEIFYSRLHFEAYREKAEEEFELCRHLRVTGFPAVFVQADDTKLYLLARGYTSYETLKARLDDALEQPGEG